MPTEGCIIHVNNQTFAAARVSSLYNSVSGTFSLADEVEISSPLLTVPVDSVYRARDSEIEGNVVLATQVPPGAIYEVARTLGDAGAKAVIFEPHSAKGSRLKLLNSDQWFPFTVPVFLIDGKLGQAWNNMTDPRVTKVTPAETLNTQCLTVFILLGISLACYVLGAIAIVTHCSLKRRERKKRERAVLAEP